MPVYLLIDNGSRQPDATLYLRRLATELSRHTGKTIHPVSLQHADTIPADELDGTPAQVFSAFLEARLAQGENEFIVVPLFFGLSKALTSFIPDQVATLRAGYPELTVKVAPVAWPLPEGEPRLARIVFDHIHQARQQNGADARIVLVDHGSPSPEITDVRKGIARRLLEEYGLEVDQAVMERREGKEYDFNGDLLATWLRQQAGQGVTEVIVAMQFFLPGRHAGPRGDVEEICEAVVKDYPQLNYTITPLICHHPLLLDILKARLAAASG
ncbi:sirohydrochlorin chelatase [Thiohalophilus thiocyanatoxydans]|uniref:Sirohydrochlorin ferrochelatase n=1 Tax=Thiohalophilus thiocyanatoxydans TaxID=381308 RepID=A0A4R8ISP5_9GAMM|nr:CbiX/SirB N-terminal domain-containing protein [Thiohalophilus thiocyanatoxydans]TDY00579.1 sirohydrochlorin ferrochelatase [Thiohalophilus thiocyanatoxydans]